MTIGFLQWALPRLPDIPDGEDDGVVVNSKVIPIGEGIRVISMRNAVLMGQRPLTITLDSNFRLTELSYEGGVWMTNAPQEIYQMTVPLEGCSEGECLIGGLGLGIFTHLHYWMGDISLTIEKDSRIINLVAPYIAEPGNIINRDLYDFLKTIHSGDFNCAFFDIWQPTGERVWVSDVVPLRRLCRGKIPNNKIFCWNEEEMLGQFRLGGCRAAFFPPEKVESWLPHWIIAMKGRELNLPIIELTTADALMEMEANVTDELKVVVEQFITGPGTDEWEYEFGTLWDKYIEEHSKGENNGSNG